ncbi:uncharacterized protein LOC129287113 [Prosopis cineraria]|uniref:uncharacterized protein LOC129287113 n=1 Tax=Prosopis cineraria TaxID=364024 RepID=UPI0024109E48|nr:uncharacterized protein LOC129287113 [Prosopis cineraria]
MGVEFTVEINIETSTRGGYRNFIQNLRTQLGVRSSHNRPALAVQQNPPNRFFDLVLRTNDHSVRFRLRMDNLYLLGYQMESGQWLELDNHDENQQLVHLITESGTQFLGFDGSYEGLERVAHQSLLNTRVGFHNLVYAINQLAGTTNWEARARSLIVVIMMFCEATRLIPVFDYMAENFHNSSDTNRNTEGTIQPWIIDLVRSWYRLSAALLRADAYPQERFHLLPNNIRIPPNNRQIRTLAEALEILGILLGLCFIGSGPKRLPRMASEEEQCFLGIPLLQVFSVRMNNIDSEDPGQLYGTITIDDGLYTRFIYNRTRGNYESISPGQNVTLIGPPESVSAFGNVNIKLLLTDKDIVSADDAIMNEDISWDAANIGHVYDKLIAKKLDSSRGSVTVNYAVLRNAVAARVTISVEEGGEYDVEVYGQASAYYNNWDQGSDDATCLLFKRSSNDYVEVRRWQTIPLLRSVIAVPLSSSLKVSARLYDHDPISADDEIANGTVEFPVPDKIPDTSFKRVDGQDGNYVTVTVYWTSGF